MGLLMLESAQGQHITIQASGTDSQQALMPFATLSKINLKGE